MDAVLIVKIIVFIAALIGSRVILHRAARGLSELQREEMLDASATVFLIRNILIFAMIFVNLVLFPQSNQLRETIEPILTIIFVVAIVLLAIINFFQINRLNLPKSLINGYLLSIAVFLVGVVVLFIPF